MDRLSRKVDVIHQTLMRRCKADCHGPIEFNANRTAEQTCGQPSGRIIRGDVRFKRYVYIYSTVELKG